MVNQTAINNTAVVNIRQVSHVTMIRSFNQCQNSRWPLAYSNHHPAVVNRSPTTGGFYSFAVYWVLLHISKFLVSANFSLYLHLYTAEAKRSLLMYCMKSLKWLSAFCCLCTGLIICTKLLQCVGKCYSVGKTSPQKGPFPSGI